MTALDLDAIRARAEAATPGPWAIWEDLTDGGFVHVGDLAGVIPDSEIATEDGVECNPTAKCYTDEDAEFIAHAREDVPALLAEVERLRRRHDPRCISLTDSEFNASCDCLTFLAIEQNRAEKAEAQVQDVRHILSSGYADFAAFQADLREAVGLDGAQP